MSVRQSAPSPHPTLPTAPTDPIVPHAHPGERKDTTEATAQRKGSASACYNPGVRGEVPHSGRRSGA